MLKWFKLSPSPKTFTSKEEFLFLKEEEIHSQVIGMELEYAFDLTPTQARALRKQLGPKRIDSYTDLNLTVIKDLNFFHYTSVKEVTLEQSPYGAEIVTHPMSWEVFKIFKEEIWKIIEQLFTFQYSATVANPSIHFNINRQFFKSDEAVAKFFTSAYKDYKLINAISGRTGARQFRSDVFALCGDLFFETDLLAFIKTKSIEFTQHYYGSFMGVHSKQGQNFSSRLELTWFATPTSKEDLELKAMFVYTYVEFCNSKYETFIEYVLNNVNDKELLVLYLNNFNKKG